VATEGDGSITVVLTPETGINGLERRSLEDIVEGVFIGTTAARNAEGRWQATEVHIFPEEMRGAGEGHYPWDFPQTTMTNATVTGTARARVGRRLELAFAGGEEEVDVPPDVPVVAFTLADRTLLRPGIAVFVLGVPQPDRTGGAFATGAETNGGKPPMCGAGATGPARDSAARRSFARTPRAAESRRTSGSSRRRAAGGARSARAVYGKATRSGPPT